MKKITKAFCLLAILVVVGMVTAQPVFADSEAVSFGSIKGISELAVVRIAPIDISLDRPYETKTLAFNVNMEDCSLHQMGDWMYLKIGDLKTFTEPGEPQLPMKTFVVKLPKSANVLGVEVTDGKYVPIKNELHIIPVPQPVTWSKDINKSKYVRENAWASKEKREIQKSETEVQKHVPGIMILPNEDIYSLDSYFPGKLISYLVGADNDYKYVFVRVYPLQYNPSEKRAILMTDATINVYYAQEGFFRETPKPYPIDSESIIISPDELFSQAEDLKNVHIDVGITATVVNTTWIWENYAEASDPPYSGYKDPSLPGHSAITGYNYSLAKKIITFLNDSGEHPNLKYVTILGNARLVPPSYYYYYSHYDTYNNWVPMDFFYSSPEYDLIPNYMVGRLPVDNIAEAEHVVGKIDSWHGNISWDWFKNATIAGGKPFGTEYYFGEMITTDSINREYFNGMNITKQFKTDGSFDAANMTNSLANGTVGMVYHIGHGSGSTMYMDVGSISASQVMSFPSKTKTPIVVSIACMNGAFDTNLMDGGFPMSFGESIVLSSAGGISYIGGARVNYGAPYFILDEGYVDITKEPYMAGMLTYVFEAYHSGGNTAGNLTTSAMNTYIAENDMTSDLNKFTLFEFVLLGDPALEIHAQVPDIAYQQPDSTALSPTGSMVVPEGTIPTYSIPIGYNISIYSETDSLIVWTKLIDTWMDQTLEKVKNDTVSGAFTYNFTPGYEHLYLVRTESEDEKEGWQYVKVEDLFAAEHDIAITELDAPTYAMPGAAVTVNATISNRGINPESDIDVEFRVSDSLLDTQTIASLPVASSVDLSFTWFNDTEGLYILSVYALPVTGETNIVDNERTGNIVITTKEPIKAVIVDSWGTDYPEYACWADLNGNWMFYGDIPIEIDYTTLNKYDMTYQDINNSGADVLIISCAAGAGREYTDSEINAIKQYVTEGHGLIGTAGTLYEYIPNNNKLAPLFGMREDIGYTATYFDYLDLIYPDYPLFRNVMSPYYPSVTTSATPPDYSWNEEDLAGGMYVAMSDNTAGSMITYRNVTYITHWIENWWANTDDKQVLYNAITWSKYEIPEHEIVVSRMSAPLWAKPDETITVNTTISNMGLNIENDIEVEFRADDSLVDSIVISTLANDSSVNLPFTWSTDIEGRYNLSVYAVPVPGEANTMNNERTRKIVITTKEPIKAVIVDSWGTDYPEYACWADLNGNWMFYGDIPIEIDYTTLNKYDMTYQDINNSGADVLIISCAAGAGREYTDSEINAIKQYVTEGHGLIGTAGTLYEYIPNNNKLAPLFGMREDIEYTATYFNYLDLIYPDHSLFRNVMSPYYPADPFGATPPDYSWNEDDLAGGMYVAMSDNTAGSMITYRNVTYITHWIENWANTDDKQVLYNAITWSKYERPEHDIVVSRVLAPLWAKPDETITVNTTLSNEGLYTENDIEVEFRVDDSLVDSIIISTLANDSSVNLSFTWSTDIEGRYNLSIYAVPEEANTMNNERKTKIFISSKKPVLLIDGDGGDSYEIYYEDALTAIEVPYIKMDTSVSSEQLLTFDNVVWLTGFYAPTTSEQANLENYLDSGGNLFISGQDMGWILVENGMGIPFYQNYLHAQYISDYSDIWILDGVSGNPVGDGLTISISGGNGANNQYWPSVISPYDAYATEIFNYTGDGCGAIRADTGTYKVVYFAFGFEAINTTSDRNTVMGRVLSWLNPPPSAFDTGSGTYPSIFGTHNGTITPSNDITVSEMYTYPCSGTGGHTEYARIWNNTGLDVTARWDGYKGDWHNITFNETFVLYKNKTYNYTIRTGSYPQVIHAKSKDAIAGAGAINCTQFVDANGKVYNDWIPAVRLFL